MPGSYIFSSSEKEEGEGEENGLVMLRIWYYFRKVMKVADVILEIY